MIVRNGVLPAVVLAMISLRSFGGTIHGARCILVRQRSDHRRAQSGSSQADRYAPASPAKCNRRGVWRNGSKSLWKAVARKR
jgi:hypothetical protein